MSIFSQIVNRLRGQVAATNSTGRDSLLDFSKGVAIILVVLGHTFQGQTEGFDELYGFRFIYAFHMPLFVFLSGAAATHWIGKFGTDSSLNELFQASTRRIGRSASQLLLPFLSWTLIFFWLGNSKVPLVEYLQEVVRHADRSLWFLPCIFWCSAYTSIFMFLFTGLRKRLDASTFPRTSRYLARLPVQMLILYIVWRYVRSKLPAEFGLVFANEFHGGLFFYYLLGVVSFRPFARHYMGIVRALPYLVFFALVPYWHRTLPHNLVQDAPRWIGIGWDYPVVVAIAGTLAVVDLSRRVKDFNINSLNRSVVYVGSASLGVYAMHIYFIDWQPQVVAAILISLLFYQLISFLPVSRMVLLGK